LVLPGVMPMAMPSIVPRPPRNPPPAHLQAPSAPSGVGGAWKKPRGPSNMQAPPNRRGAYVPSAFAEPEAYDQSGAASFVGAASRKRKLELAAERGMSLAAGYPAPSDWVPTKSAQPAYPPVVHTAPSRVPPPSRPKPAKKAPVAPQQAAVAVPGDLVKWISLPANAQFVQQGFPELGPALSYNSALQGLLSSSQAILRDLAGESADAVVLIHDPSWAEFPEVGEALKQAGGDEECMCIAQSADPALWALGLGNKWKNREQAARLALSLALAASTDMLANIESVHPDFLALCEQSSIMTGNLADGGSAVPEVKRASTPPRARAAARRYPMSVAEPLQELNAPLQTAGWRANGSAVPLKPMPAAPAGGLTPQGKLPRDVPLWIGLSAQDMPSALEGLAPTALVISTEGKGRKGGFYSSAVQALGSLAGEEQVQYLDDANWEHFPQVGEALKEIGSAEECLTVAVCSARDVWAVGVCMKGKDRYMAAKAALAASLALQLESIGEDADLSEFPALADFVEEARAARG